MPEVNVDKVETLPVVVAEQENLPAPAMVPLSKVSSMMAAVDDVVKSVMREDTDYGTIPGTKKPTLYKAGAEKLNAVFGLSARFELLDSVEDHFKEWEYDRVVETEWDPELKKKVPIKVDKGCRARGFFYYRYRCTLTSRGGLFAGDAEGSFSSMEPGRETAPANTIQKMAQKRALVAATLLATFSSDRFTQDLEDAGTPPTDRKKSGGAPSSGESLPGVEAEMKSKKDKVGFCWYCKEYHINSGDIIVKAKIPEKDNPVWGAKDCYAKHILKPEDDAPESGPGTSEEDTRNALTDKVQEWETVRFGDGADVKVAAKIEAARKKNMGSADLNKASEVGLENYLEYLEKD